MLASHVNDSNQLRGRAEEMRASSKELKDNNTAVVIFCLADLYDRLADRAEMRSNGVPLGKSLAQSLVRRPRTKMRPSLVEQF
jgi:hypothetical protein